MSATTFEALGVSPPILSALSSLGYEMPTPVQQQAYQALLDGKDLLAQAQTGTGKTGAFAIPLLDRMDVSVKQVQVLVIAPTRELAIQVAEAFQSYSKSLKGFHVAPIYGGQDYQVQLRALKRGAQVIVGTPGRVMDHIRRGSLVLDGLMSLVLDEADEMLKMGFKEDVEWILEQIPQQHQTALFSATMPPAIQNITRRYLKDPAKIQIKPTETTVDAIEQYFIRVNRTQKMDVLTRLLEVEDVQAALIFARTKTLSAELAEKLQARGYSAAALNGDMSQSMREKVLGRLKKGSLDIIVATDVAARGIDVDRISHVFNYDIPSDPESYVHRIGRTGRAGRTGKAFMFVSSREQHLLNDIERVLRKPIERILPPSLAELSARRSQQLAEKVVNIIHKSKKYHAYKPMIDNIIANSDCALEDVAASLVYLLQEANPLPSDELTDVGVDPDAPKRRRRGGPSRRSSRGDAPHGARPKRSSRSSHQPAKASSKRRSAPTGKRTAKKPTKKR